LTCQPNNLKVRLNYFFRAKVIPTEGRAKALLYQHDKTFDKAIVFFGEQKAG